MTSSNEEYELLKKVLILALYNRKKGDTIQDVLIELDELKAISLKESKKLLKELKKEDLFINGEFSPLGLIKVQEAQQFFTL